MSPQTSSGETPIKTKDDDPIKTKEGEKAIRYNRSRVPRRIRKLNPFLADPKYGKEVEEFWRLKKATKFAEVKDLVPKELMVDYPDASFSDLRDDLLRGSAGWLESHNSLDNPLNIETAKEVGSVLCHGEQIQFRIREFLYRKELYAAFAFGLPANEDERFGSYGEAIHNILFIKQFPKKQKTREMRISPDQYFGELLQFDRRLAQSWKDDTSLTLKARSLATLNSVANPVDVWNSDWISEYSSNSYSPKDTKERKFEIEGVKYGAFAYGFRAVEGILFIKWLYCSKCQNLLQLEQWVRGGVCRKCQKEDFTRVQAHITEPAYQDAYRKFRTIWSQLKASSHLPPAPIALKQLYHMAQYLHDNNSFENPLDNQTAFDVAELLVDMENYTPFFYTTELLYQGTGFKVLVFGNTDNVKGSLFVLNEEIPAKKSVLTAAEFDAKVTQFLTSIKDLRDHDHPSRD